MTVVFEASYAKKLGLPNYSSHQYSVTVRTELADLIHVDEATARFYDLLQTSVDREIKKVGFLPAPGGAGFPLPVRHGAGAKLLTPTGRNEPRSSKKAKGAWSCTSKQRGLIERLIRENQLEKGDVQKLALTLFGEGVRSLNKVQASRLIDVLLEPRKTRSDAGEHTLEPQGEVPPENVGRP